MRMVDRLATRVSFSLVMLQVTETWAQVVLCRAAWVHQKSHFFSEKPVISVPQFDLNRENGPVGA